MFDRIKAKENAKTLLRTRTFFDVIGFFSILCISVTALWFCFLALLPIYLLLRAGMIRSALRIHRGDKNVRVVDIILAGDRLGRNISITLWQLLFYFLWNLPSAAVSGIAIVLIVANSSNIPFAIILFLMAGVWSLYISIRKYCQYFFACCISEDKRELSGLDCISESKALIVNHEWDLFVTVLSFLGWDILGFIAGVYTIPYKVLTYTGIYEQLNNRFYQIPRNQMVWSFNKPVSGSSSKAVEPGIEFISGEFAGSGLPINSGEEICIGRDPKRANVVTSSSNTSVSGLHCCIHFDENQKKYVVVDHSSNGTWVNNQKLMPESSIYTNPGSVVKIADGAIIFRLS